MLENIKDLNKIPSKIISGEISDQAAVYQLSEFITKNKPLFNLQKYDEDFTSEIILTFLEKGTVLFESYQVETGSFYNYLFTYLKNIAYTKTRACARYSLQESYKTNESIYDYSEKVDSYHKITLGQVEEIRVPYAANKVSPKALRQGLKIACIKQVDKKHHSFILADIMPEKKALLVVSLKSAFYLTDSKIESISQICNVNQNDMCTVVQEIKEELMPRIERKYALEERRNKIYYNYCKYLIQSNSTCYSQEKKEFFSIKAKETKLKLDRINGQLKKGKINIRPSNKIIADILGISERQISYYIKYAKDCSYFQKLIGENIG